MVLTYDAYSETMDEKRQKEIEIKELKDKYEQDMKDIRQEIREMMKEQLAQLAAQLKPEVLKHGLVNNKI
jgi:flagellar biosynthesis/type III secretory pathway protein FliH